jgi:hypothetical protein
MNQAGAIQSLCHRVVMSCALRLKCRTSDVDEAIWEVIGPSWRTILASILTNRLSSVVIDRLTLRLGGQHAELSYSVIRQEHSFASQL